jgi:hypothetical protein
MWRTTTRRLGTGIFTGIWEALHSSSDLMAGKLDVTQSPKFEVCPADARLKSPNLNIASWNPQGLIFGLRSFAMVGVGPKQGTQWQVPPYVLPPIQLGVGIYWTAGSGTVDTEAKSYKTSVVRDQSGSILLAEVVDEQNIANDQWPCISVGVVGGGQATDFYQFRRCNRPSIITGRLHTRAMGIDLTTCFTMRTWRACRPTPQSARWGHCTPPRECGPSRRVTKTVA